MDEDDDDRADRAGLAAERTDIAWSRSALAIVACSAAILRRVPKTSRATTIVLILSILMMLTAASLILRRRITADERDPAIDRSRQRLQYVATMTSLTGALCLVVML